MNNINALAPCPASPNCVSSLAEEKRQRVDPLPVRRSTAESLAVLRGVIAAMPRATVVAANEHTLHAEFRSLLGFIDDVTCMIDEDGGVIHIRSASRTGYWDVGVNRRRVEGIRVRYLDAVRKIEPEV
ncbi:MAG: DUF1499 domain-containing protein [Chloroflexota bacterium]